MNLAGSVLNVLSAAPDQLALTEPSGRRVLRGDLLECIQAVAAQLRGRGLVAGERVVIQVPNGTELIASTLAVLALGGVPVLLEGGLGDGVYLDRIRAAEPTWLVVHPLLHQLGAWPSLRRVAAIAGLSLPPLPPADRQLLVSRTHIDRWLAEGSVPDVSVAERAPSDPCIVVYTGGTTSAPKGVLHTHGSLRAFLENIRSLGDLGGVERFVVDTLPQALYVLYLGAEAHLAHGKGKRRARRVLSLLREGHIQAYFGAPYLWQEMMRVGGTDRLPPTLKSVLLGSAPVRPRFLRQLRGFLDPSTTVTSLYGMTEAGPVCIASLEDKLGWTGGGDLVGRPVDGTTVTIDAPDGEVGEVRLAGPSVSPGYLGQPPRGPADPLHTGDLGILVDTTTGPVLVLHGRSKEMVIRRGVNLYPRTLEGPILAAFSAEGLPVDDCALFGEWDEHDQDEHLVLAVAGPPDLDLTAVHTLAARAAGPDGAPDRVVRLDAFPVKGRQNKRDLATLKDQVRGGTALTRPKRLQDALLPFGASDFVRRAVVRSLAGQGVGRVAVEMGLRSVVYGISQLTWAVDELVASDWRTASGRGPLFIVGHQRSGTTALHRLLASDTPHARALTLAEMLFPAVSAQPLLRGVAGLDRWTGGALRRLEDRVFGPMDPLHRIRMGEVEEDEFVLWAVFSSIMVANDDPLAVERRQLDHLRHFDRWPKARRERVLGFYRDVLLKRLHRDRTTEPGQRWMVAKNPAFTQKIPALARLFPDARFVYLIRDPRLAIASRLRLIRAIWAHRFPTVPALTPTQVDVILEDSLRTYRCAERDLYALPEDRRLVVRHTDLHADPSAVVARIYTHFDLPGPPPVATTAAPPTSTVTDVPLDPARIVRELPEVFERYGFSAA